MSLFTRAGQIVQSKKDKKVQDQNLTSLLSYQSNYSAARDAPESRYATRALGDRSDLGVPSLTLGSSAPAPTVRTLDELLDGRMRSLFSMIGRGYR